MVVGRVNREHESAAERRRRAHVLWVIVQKGLRVDTWIVKRLVRWTVKLKPQTLKLT